MSCPGIFHLLPIIIYNLVKQNDMLARILPCWLRYWWSVRKVTFSIGYRIWVHSEKLETTSKFLLQQPPNPSSLELSIRHMYTIQLNCDVGRMFSAIRLESMLVNLLQWWSTTYRALLVLFSSLKRMTPKADSDIFGLFCLQSGHWWS